MPRSISRAAYAHIMIKVIGVCILIPFFPWYVEAVKNYLGIDPTATVIINGSETYSQAMTGIAFSHTAVNIFFVLLFLPLVGPFAKVLMRLVPEPPAEGTPSTNDDFDDEQQVIAGLANELVGEIDAASAALN